MRELENVIERTLVLVDGPEVSARDLPLSQTKMSLDGGMAELPAGAPVGQIPLNEMLDKMERELIERAMEEANQVKTRAADILQIKTSALYYKLDKYGLE